MKTQTIRISDIEEGYNPRKDFGDEEALLSDIQKHGLETPIGARLEGGKPVTFEGNRRLRVLKKLGQEEVPCVVKEMDMRTAAHRSYLHNTGKLRKNLNPIEEAAHLKWLQDNFNYSVKNLVDEGYANDDQTIYNKLSLLNLPEEAQQQIAEGEISPTVGYELAKKTKTEAQAKKMVKNLDTIKDLSVRRAKKVISQIDLEEKPGKKEEEPPQMPEGKILGVHFNEPGDMSDFKDESICLLLANANAGVSEDNENGVTTEAQNLHILESLPAWGKKLAPGGILGIRFSDNHDFGTGNKTEPEIELRGHLFQDALRQSDVRLRDIIVLDKGRTLEKQPEDLFGDGTKHTSYRHINKFEYIYIFKKDGERGVPDDLKLKSRIPSQERNELEYPIWQIAPKKKEDQVVRLQEEIASRVIKMNSFVGDLVVDTALGSGVTLDVAKKLGRNVVGYERDRKFEKAILNRLGPSNQDPEPSAAAPDANKSDEEAQDSTGEAVKVMERMVSVKESLKLAPIFGQSTMPVLAAQPQADRSEGTSESTHSAEPKAMEAGWEEGVL